MVFVFVFFASCESASVTMGRVHVDGEKGGKEEGEGGRD